MHVLVGMSSITRPVWAVRPALTRTELPADFAAELAAMGLKAPYLTRKHGPLVTPAELAGLPASVRRYFDFMNVVGRPRDWSFRLGFSGRFRRSVSEPWMTCTAWQYDTVDHTRIFHMRARLFGLLPFVARDTHVDGHGRMLVRLFDRFTVADGRGEPFDIGELVTWLNDATLIDPSMLLTPSVTFGAVDTGHFTVSVSDHLRTVTATVSIDDRGAPLDFDTRDRFYADPTGLPLRCQWTTPVEGWREQGRPAALHPRAGRVAPADR